MHVPLSAAFAVVALLARPVGAERWPTWPTEIDRVASPLREAVAQPVPEAERRRAVEDLEQFPTELIVDPIVGALDDPSAQVREAALEVCYRREIAACVPAAASLWSQGREPQLRMLALRVLALDPDPTRVVLLLGALRDANEQLRAQAAQYLGWSPLPAKSRAEARAALLAKLSDPAASVRLRAVETLGLFGPGDGTLAVARLLEDPEPSVRGAAARALALHRDARSVPALLRAIDGQNETHVAAAILAALAQLPGEELPQELLIRLDDPPSGMQTHQVAEAIGTRPNPEPALIDGLVERLREPALRRPVLRALLLLGEPARSHLIAARERGLEPSLDLEVQRLLLALDPISEAPAGSEAWPDQHDAAAWLSLMQSQEEERRFEVASALAGRAPSWLDAAASAVLATPGPPGRRRPWLLAVAAAPRSVTLDDFSRGRLEAWARDEALGVGDRCLSILALGQFDRRRERRKLEGLFQSLAGNRRAEIRGCTALALAGDREGTLLQLLLLDAEPVVRASASLALADAPEALEPAVSARLGAIAAEDPSAEVRAAARHALEHQGKRAPGRPTFFREDRRGLAWAQPDRFFLLAGDADQRLWIPAFEMGGSRWGLLPVGDDLELVTTRP